MLKSLLFLTRGKVYDEVINRLGLRLQDQNRQSSSSKDIQETEDQLTFMYKVKLSTLPEPSRDHATKKFKADFGTPKNYQDWSKMYELGRSHRTLAAGMN